MMHYDTMSIDELEAENARLMAERAALRKQQQALVAAIDTKRAEAAVAADLQALQARHGVTVQVVAPSAIDSAEQVKG